MRWGDFRRSDNVEEGSYGGGGGAGFGGPIRLSGGAIVIAVIASLLFGVNPLDMLGAMMGGGSIAPSGGQQTAPAPSQSGQAAIGSDQTREFSARVLGSTEYVWSGVFQKMGKRYDPPTLHFFSGAVQSACGQASTAAGPFYCSADRRVYLDTAFFQELQKRFGAPGDFAQGYVIAHEVGHHVQNLLGIMDQFGAEQQRMDDRSRNALSVKLELQADCFAGVWGHFLQADQKLDPGDIEEGIRAASAVGDDTIQKRSRGYVVPDSFTHGSAEQRTRWFRTGFDSGDIRACNTFGGRG